MTAGTDSMYDVIIVGGRPAGATLAARLGARGYRVLLVDRATFPSLPAVPSAPTIHPGAMHLLDELGIPEERYATGAAPMPWLSIQMDNHFDTVMKVPLAFGRRYVHGIDRRIFDEVLWTHVARFSSVVQRQAFVVTDVLRDGAGRVIGIVGNERGGAAQQITARCVVGADGRFSLVARKCGARIAEEELHCLSTVYFAEWENVAPFRPELEGGAHIHATGRGLDILFFALPQGRMQVITHHRADHVDIQGNPHRYYHGVLERLPAVSRRLRGARQVSAILGVKRIGNGYRQSSGPGWVLVGDAVHYKDPVDGQGIYDALLGAQLLDASLASWLGGSRDWSAAMGDYARALRAATLPMYRETVKRLRRELYADVPPIVAKTVMRWMLTDPAYQDRFLSFLCRNINPENWLDTRFMAGAILRGLWRDVTGLGSQGPRKDTLAAP